MVLHIGMKKSLSHLILMKNNRIVSMAQAKVFTFPFIKGGIVYIYWGPMWKDRDKLNTLEDLQQMLLSLKHEYVYKRGYSLRILPNGIYSFEHDIINVFSDEGFKWGNARNRTIYLNLEPTMDILLNNMHRSQRKTIRRAQKEPLTFIEDVSDSTIDYIYDLHNKMVKRKQYEEKIDMRDIVMAHKDLPTNLKLQNCLCYYEGEPVGGLSWSRIGDTGIGLISGSNDKGTSINIGYVLWMRMIEYYKNNNIRWLDMAGINKETNPGGYFFKKGLGGKDAIEDDYIGIFEIHSSLFNMLLIRSSEIFYNIIKKFRIFIHNVEVKAK